MGHPRWTSSDIPSKTSEVGVLDVVTTQVTLASSADTSLAQYERGEYSTARDFFDGLRKRITDGL